MIDFTQAIQEIEHAIHEGSQLLPWGYAPTPHAPNSYHELKLAAVQSHNNHAPLPVLSLNAESIYPNYQTGIALRAWHDYLHLSLRKPFTLKGELAVTVEHLRSLTDPIARVLLYFDTYAQVAWWHQNRTYITNQREWVFTEATKHLEAHPDGHIPQLLLDPRANPLPPVAV